MSFDPYELVRWAEIYGHPEEWAQKAKAAHLRAEKAEWERDREAAVAVASEVSLLRRAEKAEKRILVLEGALRVADDALRRARDGLDFGLGCARDLEDDDSPMPVEPRSRRADDYLKKARHAHETVRAALASEGIPEEARGA